MKATSHGAIAYLRYQVDRAWLGLFVIALLVGVWGTVGIVAAASTSPPPAETVAAGFSIDDDRMVTLEDDSVLVVGIDGLYARSHDETIASSYVYEIDASHVDAVTLDIVVRTVRLVDGVILWRHDDPIDVEIDPTATTESVDVVVDLAAHDQVVDTIDARLRGPPGSVRIEVIATLAVETGEGRHRVRSTLTVTPDGEVYAVDPGETVRSTSDVTPTNGRVRSSSAAVGGWMAAIALVVARRRAYLPSDDAARLRIALDAMRWRYGHLFVESDHSLVRAHRVKLDDPTALVRIAKARRRQILLDRDGTAAIFDDDVVFLWTPPAAPSSRNATQGGDPSCRTHDARR